MIQTVTALMNHQADAVEKLKGSRVGALFMEMGTGKSRTIIELACLKQEKISKIVWACPVALKTTVKYEIMKHTDTAPEQIYLFNSKSRAGKIPSVMWYIAGIESVSSSDRVAAALARLIDRKTMVIVDESSYIKGAFAKRTTRITQYAQKARYRYLLTGTPISQGIVDLYAQFRFLSPDILGYHSFYGFARNHLEYSDKYPGKIIRSHNISYLTSKIEPYVFQVTKEECFDLPKKSYDIAVCDMTKEQNHAYDMAKEYYFLRILSRRRTGFGDDILALFNALQQIASGFWNRHEESGFVLYEYPQERLDTLKAVINEIPEDQKIIIWAKYHYEIDGILKMISSNELGEYAVFDGRVSQKKRNAELEKFRTSARFFVSTQSCGGHGLTLNESAHTIFYSNTFKYSERLQAEDRNHRYGQTRKVLYIDVYPECGIEGRIQDALNRKKDAVEEFKQSLTEVKDDPDAMRKLIMEL